MSPIPPPLQPPKPTFLTLPLEIRHLIYEQLLVLPRPPLAGPGAFLALSSPTTHLITPADLVPKPPNDNSNPDNPPNNPPKPPSKPSPPRIDISILKTCLQTYTECLPILGT